MTATHLWTWGWNKKSNCCILQVLTPPNPSPRPMTSTLACFSLKTLFSFKSIKKKWKFDEKITAGWQKRFPLCLFVWVWHMKWNERKKNQHESLYKSGGKKEGGLGHEEDPHGWSSANLWNSFWFIHRFCKILPDTLSAHTHVAPQYCCSHTKKKKVISGFILKTSQRQNIAAEFSLTHRWTHLQFLVCCVSNAGSRPSGSFGPKQNLPQ